MNIYTHHLPVIPFNLNFIRFVSKGELNRNDVEVDASVKTEANNVI